MLAKPVPSVQKVQEGKARSRTIESDGFDQRICFLEAKIFTPAQPAIT